jgi:endonuclease III
MRKLKQRPIHHAEDFGLNIFSGDSDLFRWFLLSYLFGKPIRSNTAVQTWKLLVDRKFDTPWAITEAPRRKIVRLMYEGGYTRYAEVTTTGLKECMTQLIRDYEGSLLLMYEYSESQDEMTTRLQKLYGVGPKVAEIFMRDVEEMFARRVE